MRIQPKRFVFAGILLLGIWFSGFCQEKSIARFDSIQKKLNALSSISPGLLENVELSVNGVSIQEFVRGIAVQNNINVTVDPALNISVVNNFANVPVQDVLLFLCKNYGLD